MIEQYSAHIVHTSDSRGVESFLAFKGISGSSASANCFFQSRLDLALDISLSRMIAEGIPFTISAAWAAILDAMTP